MVCESDLPAALKQPGDKDQSKAGKGKSSRKKPPGRAESKKKLLRAKAKNDEKDAKDKSPAKHKSSLHEADLPPDLAQSPKGKSQANGDKRVKDQKAVQGKGKAGHAKTTSLHDADLPPDRAESPTKTRVKDKKRNKDDEKVNKCNTDDENVKTKDKPVHSRDKSSLHDDDLPSALSPSSRSRRRHTPSSTRRRQAAHSPSSSVDSHTGERMVEEPAQLDGIVEADLPLSLHISPRSSRRSPPPHKSSTPAPSPPASPRPHPPTSKRTRVSRSQRSMELCDADLPSSATHKTPHRPDKAESSDSETVELEPYVRDDKQERVRSLVINELVTTEQTYIKELKALVDVYLIPIASKSLLDSAPGSPLFNFLQSAKAIQILHEKFCKELRGLMRDEPRLHHVLLDYAEFFRIYFPYVQQYAAVSILMGTDASKSLLKFLSVTSTKHKHNGIAQLLILPIQRIPRYVLLLQRLLEETPANHPLHKAIKKVDQKIGEVAKRVDEAEKQSAQSAHLFALQSKVTNIPDNWRILCPSRILVHSAVVTFVFGGIKNANASLAPPGEHPFKKKNLETVRLFLFSDCVLLTTWNHKYRYRMDLDEIAIHKPLKKFIGLEFELLANAHDGKEADPGFLLMCSGSGERNLLAKLLAKLKLNVVKSRNDRTGKGGTTKVKQAFTSVNVYLRVRPFVLEEEEADGTECVSIDKNVATLTQTSLAASRPDRVCAYDRIFGPAVDQRGIFEGVGQEILGAIFTGLNVAVMAYGNTGAGKTHTMFGEVNTQNKGVIPRILESLFTVFRNGNYESYSMKLSYLQVYNENIQDLQGDFHRGTSSDDVPSLPIKQRKGKGRRDSFYVDGLVQTEIRDIDDALFVVERGNKVRTTRKHKLNDVSSRSHALLILNIESQLRGQKVPLCSKVHLFDLAGSENVTLSGVTGAAEDEAKYINKSLVSLGRVIHALNENRKRTKGKQMPVPFRESKLTHLLSDVLQGEFVCSVILNASCSPALGQVGETGKTMVFGEGIKKLQRKKPLKATSVNTFLAGVWTTVHGTKGDPALVPPVPIGPGLRARYHAERRSVSRSASRQRSRRGSRSVVSAYARDSKLDNDEKSKTKPKTDSDNDKDTPKHKPNDDKDKDKDKDGPQERPMSAPPSRRRMSQTSSRRRVSKSPSARRLAVPTKGKADDGKIAMTSLTEETIEASPLTAKTVASKGFTSGGLYASLFQKLQSRPT